MKPAEPALYRAVPAGHTGYDNASLAELFVTLTFETEWGGTRERLARFEAPVTVGIEGRGAEAHRSFLRDYVVWLARHTGIDIRLGGPRRQMHLRLVPGGAFSSLLPTAACVLVPGDLAWERFEAAPDRLGGMAMQRAERLEAVTVFMPDTAAPAEIRGCILEEVAQGLGPLNDLYGLGPSVFNDDFGHLWPTRLDLLMLRVLYDPALSTGLGRREARARAFAVLERINPAGHAAPPIPHPEHAAEGRWRKLIARATTRERSLSDRRRSARAALDFAEAALNGTAQHCFTLETAAQVLSQTDPAAAADIMARAEACVARVHGVSDPRTVRVRLARAGLALALAEPARALALSDGLDTALADHGLDEALAAYYALRARALESLGERAAAGRAERHANDWRAYALGR